ncbi:MAG: universal stress protein [Pseudomonadales bacterium]
MRFSKILVALKPGTDHTPTLRRAANFARNQGADLSLCAVVDQPTVYDYESSAYLPPFDFEAIVASERARLTQIVQSTAYAGLSISVKVLLGKQDVEVARLVEEFQYDLVIKAAGGPRSMATPSPQREDRTLMRHCPCPVWIVGTAAQADDGCVLAALDIPADEEIDLSLNEHILEVSQAIALAEFRSLHVVHAWHLTGEGFMRARGNARINAEVDRMVARERVRREKLLHEAVNAAQSRSHRAAIDYLAPDLHVVNGRPASVVPRLAKDLKADLIVMGTAARTGLAGLWLGNTSEKVLKQSRSSFLIVKAPPAGQKEGIAASLTSQSGVPATEHECA